MLALLLVLVSVLGAGCVRVRAGLAVSPEDTVSGVIDIGTPDGTPDGTGPPLQVPSELSGDVNVERYEQDGYIGSRVRFTAARPRWESLPVSPCPGKCLAVVIMPSWRAPLM